MAKYYTVKLTEDQYFHLFDVLEEVKDSVDQNQPRKIAMLHEQTQGALMKAKEKNGEEK